ncbi:MAG: polysaccharide pyruvyl transferase family protein [Alphaproteobacteria bacterium]
MTVFIFNDRFSANLGDGLLAESLEHHLQQALPNMRVCTLDVDGKTGYATLGYGAVEGWKKYIWMPVWMRRAVRCKRAYKRLQNHIAQKTAQVGNPTAFVVGGGHLITATSDYFPIRLLAIMDYATARNIPVFIHAVGVSHPSTWGAGDASMLRQALMNRPCLRRVAVRDAPSQTLWNDTFGTPLSMLAKDPGLVGDVVVAGAPANTMLRRIGLGVMQPKVVADIMKNTSPLDAAFYHGVARGLVEQGLSPYLFTNGDGADEAFLSHVMQTLPADMKGKVQQAPMPRTPVELLTIIRSCTAIVAQRLHANIAAWSLNIPHVGLGWDPKLLSFFKLTEREACFVPAEGCSVAHVVDIALNALKTPLDTTVTHALRHQTVQDVKSLAHEIQSIIKP